MIPVILLKILVLFFIFSRVRQKKLDELFSFPKSAVKLGIMKKQYSGKIAIYMVSLLGILGLSFSLLYLVASILTFMPGFAWISKIMIGDDDSISYGFLGLLIPYIFLILHLYLRTRLGPWLNAQKNFGASKNYIQKRQTQNLLRNASEAFANRGVQLAIFIREEDWENAIALTKKYSPKKKNLFYWYWYGWNAELFWRLDDSASLKKLFEKCGDAKGSYIQRYTACRAQFYEETNEHQLAITCLERGAWKHEDNARVKVSTSVIRHEKDTNAHEAWVSYTKDIPSAAVEFALFFSEPILSGSSDPRSLRLMEESYSSKEI